MTAHEWQPGDLALVTGPARLVGEGGELATKRALRVLGCWYVGKGTGWNDGEVHEVRPLLTLDPDDRDQSNRLAAAYWANLCEQTGNRPYNATASQQDDAMQAALRSLLAPERPAEPLGLGAVVKDADGHRWVRSQWDANYPWTPAEDADLRAASNERACEWSDLPAPTVLADGYTGSES